MSKNYDGLRAGMLRAAQMARNEFKRVPEAAKGRDCVYMGGYEDACDHLSAAIAQAAVIDSVRVAGTQPDWQYHIALLLPDEGVEDAALLKVFQVVEHELLVTSSSRDIEIREVLEGLRTNVNHYEFCWCRTQTSVHTSACLATRVLWDKLNSTTDTKET